MNWVEIRARLATIKPAEIGALFDEALGKGPWLTVYSDWLARWGFENDCGPDRWSQEAVRTANLDAFLRDSMTPCPSDPEALAVLTALRVEFQLQPRDGTGRTSGEALGIIRQAMREHAIARAATARHQGLDGDEAYRDGLLPNAGAAIERLCGIVGKLAERLGVTEADCFCGRHENAQSETAFGTFETGWKFDGQVLDTLERLIEAVPQTTKEE